MVTIILLSKICFPNSSFTLDVTFERIISRWSTTDNKLTHFIGHDGLKVVCTHVDSSTFCNSLTISTIIYVNFFSSCHSCEPFPFEGSCSLTSTSLRASFLMVIAITRLMITSLAFFSFKLEIFFWSYVCFLLQHFLNLYYLRAISFQMTLMVTCVINKKKCCW